MKCPVCKTELSASTVKCPTCMFSDLSKEFINVSDATNWVDNVVVPYRKKWETAKSASPLSIYQSMIASQLNQTLATESDASDFEYEIDANGVTITRYNGSGDAVIIPGEIGGHIVVRLGEGLFKGCKELSTIELPQTLTEICSRAFSGTGIQEIIIPDRVETIGDSAFAGCDKLKKISLPETLKAIGEGTFWDAAIEEIILPRNVKVIPEDLFRRCMNLKIVVITGAVKINQRAFMVTPKLSMLSLPDGLEVIEEKAFRSSHLQKVIIPASVKQLNVCDFDVKHVAILGMDTQFLGWNYSFDKSTVFYCHNGSTAQAYARSKNIATKALDQFEL